MSKDKLIFTVYPNETSVRRGVVRVNDKAWETILSVQRETGLTYTKIVSDMVLYASDHYEIRER